MCNVHRLNWRAWISTGKSYEQLPKRSHRGRQERNNCRQNARHEKINMSDDNDGSDGGGGGTVTDSSGVCHQQSA